MADPGNDLNASKKSNEKIFFYQADNKNSVNQKGEMRALNIRQAKILLERQGMTKIKLKEKKEANIFFRRSLKKVKVKDIVFFTRQMATMGAAGIPLVQCFMVLIESSEHNGVTKLTNDIKTDVESGSSFSQALRKRPKYFDELFCSLVEAGEQSGKLDVMLARIAHYKEKIETLKGKIKKALYYPTAVVAVAMIVSVVLLVKVVPTFKSLFAGFGAELPPFTLFVLQLSDAVQNHALVIVIGAIVFALAFRYCHRNFKKFRDTCDKITLKLPIFGVIFKKVITARFARTLATTFAAGVPLADGLDAIAKATGNIVYYDAIMTIKNDVTTGIQMKTAMRNSQVFEPLVTQMIGIGEESGKLEAMLSKVADIYDEEVDFKVDGLTALLEPLIMIFLGVIVGGLVVAMYLPIFKMGSVI